MQPQSTVDALIADATSSPDDLGPRLILADYLDDHGEPVRAANIRTQCERWGYLRAIVNAVDGEYAFSKAAYRHWLFNHMQAVRAAFVQQGTSLWTDHLTPTGGKMLDANLPAWLLAPLAALGFQATIERRDGRYVHVYIGSGRRKSWVTLEYVNGLVKTATFFNLREAADLAPAILAVEPLARCQLSSVPYRYACAHEGHDRDTCMVVDIGPIMNVKYKPWHTFARQWFDRLQGADSVHVHPGVFGEKHWWTPDGIGMIRRDNRMTAASSDALTSLCREQSIPLLCLGVTT